MFIYKWSPFEICEIFREPNKNPQLKIVKTYEFHNLKGYTPFIDFGSNELVGVVHFSEETKSRS
jgi:hypothetical protein